MNVREKEKANTQSDQENESDKSMELTKCQNGTVNDKEASAKKEIMAKRYYWKFDSKEQEMRFKSQIEAINDFYYENMQSQ